MDSEPTRSISPDREYVDTVLTLLDDHTKQLRHHAEHYNAVQVRSSMYGSLALLCLLSVYGLVMFFSIHNNFILKPVFSDRLTSYDLLFTVLLITGILLIISSALLLFQTRQRRNILRFDMFLEIEQLGKLIRHASQLLEAGAYSFPIKLQLDFKVSDAEMTARFARHILSASSASSMFIDAGKRAESGYVPADRELAWSNRIDNII